MNTLITWLKARRDNSHFDANSGQAIVLIALAAIGLIAIMGLAIDGGRLLFLRRETQTAADAAAIAAARALCTERDPEPYALSVAGANGFDNDAVDNWVTVNTPPINASIEIPEECRGCYVETEIKGQIPPSFISIVYDGELAATGHAVGICNPDVYNSASTASAIRAVWAMNECSPNGVTITGSNIYIEGGLHSNGSMKIMPSQGGGEVVGATSAVTPHSDTDVVHGQDKITWSSGNGSGSGSGSQTSTGTCLASCFSTSTPSDTESVPADGTPYLTDAKSTYPVDFDISQFQPGGTYYQEAYPSNFYEFSCSGSFWDWVTSSHMTGSAMDDGIYYANCDIDIKNNNHADNVTGKVTIVTTGQLHVHGDGQQWESYVQDANGNGLIMFSNVNAGCGGPGAIKFSGSNNTWNGIVFAPYGTIKMSASANDSSAGCLIGYSVEVSGADNRIICDTNSSTPDPVQAISLGE